MLLGQGKEGADWSLEAFRCHDQDIWASAILISKRKDLDTLELLQSLIENRLTLHRQTVPDMKPGLSN